MDAYLSFDVGVVNLAYCLLDKEENILLWDVVNIKAPSYDKQCEKLIMELDKIDYESLENDYNITVVIERQPCRNPKMRVISGQIQMYFALKKYLKINLKPSLKDGSSYISKILYYSPKYKLKCYTPQEGDIPIVEKKYKSSYTARKNLAKQHCSIMINRNQKQEIIDKFNTSKKKDDYSDSYLQGIAYIRFNGK